MKPSIHPWPRTRRQWWMRSCIMPGLPTHLVQGLMVGIVGWVAWPWRRIVGGFIGYKVPLFCRYLTLLRWIKCGRANKKNYIFTLVLGGEKKRLFILTTGFWREKIRNNIFYLHDHYLWRENKKLFIFSHKNGREKSMFLFALSHLVHRTLR